MNMDTGSLDNETQDFTPGLPVNKFEKTAYADDDENGLAMMTDISGKRI